MFQKNDNVFRDFEKELDAHHKTLQIGEHPADQAILGILIAYDSFSYLKLHSAAVGDVPAEQKWKRLRVTAKKNCDLFLTPFIEVSGFTTWSPTVLTNSKAIRNLLKLMTRTGDLKAMADNIIGGRERAFLSEVGLFLAQHGYQFKLTQKIKCDTTEGEIDLLAYRTRYPRELLLIEGKAFLGVDEINEVEAATQEMIKGQTQLLGVIGILDALSLESKQIFYPFVDWQAINEVYPLILTTEAEPNEKLAQETIPAMAFTTLKMRLRPADLDRPSRIWHACSKRKWLSTLDGGKSTWISLKIGKITYEIPVVDFTPDKE